MREITRALGLLLFVPVACVESPASPDLVTVSGLSPQIVELSDTLQVSGHGFPEGVPARLSFRGDIYRAGQVPERNVNIVVRTQETTKDTVTLAVNDELEQAFCGAGDVAAHASFRGNVNIAFSPRAAGMAPVSGTLRDVNFEVEPKLKSFQVERERQRVSHEAQQFLGLTLGDSGPSDCCTVVAAEGRALLAGISPGDRLVDFDGVSVIRPSDLVPSGRNRTARLTLRRAGSETPLVRSIDVQGFRWTIPSELAPALGCLLAALGILFAAVSPIRTLLRSLASAMARGLDKRLIPGKFQASLGHFYTVIKQCASDVPLPESATVKIAGVGSVVALGSLSAVMTIREELLSSELDLPLWWLLTTFAITLTAFLLSLAHVRSGFVRSLVFATQAILHQIPLLGLIVSIMVVTRTSRLADIVHVQGAFPQDWLLVHDPALAVTAILALVALVPTVAPQKIIRTPNSETDRESNREASSSGASLISFLANRLHVWIQALLLAILLLGGWSVPGGEVAGNGQLTLKMLAIAVLLLKTWAIVAVVSLVRWSVGSLSLRHTARWVLRRGLPLTISTSFLTFVWAFCVRYWAILWADAVVHWVVLGLLLATGGLLVRLTLNRLRRGLPLSPLNPWI